MSNSRALSADWTRVLARVEKALGEAMVRLKEREQAMATAGSQPQATTSLDFSRFEQLVADFAARPDSAERRLAQFDGIFRDGEEALRQWLGRAEAVRRKMTNWVGKDAKK